MWDHGHRDKIAFSKAQKRDYFFAFRFLLIENFFALFFFWWTTISSLNITSGREKILLVSVWHEVWGQMHVDCVCVGINGVRGACAMF